MGVADYEADWAAFEVSDDYKWTLLVTMVMVFHYVIFVTFGATAGIRNKLFS